MFKKGFQKIKKTYLSFPIVIHPMFLIFGFFCTFIGLLDIFICYVVSAILHELGHFIVAKRLGYKMVKIRLMPYGAELCGNLDEFLYSDDVKIAIAGPVTSLLLAIFIVCLWWLFPSCYEWTREFCISNIVCAIFNMLPIYPLDGGRVLVAVLSKNLKRSVAVRYAKNATRIFSLLLFALFIISIFYTLNISFGVIGIMLYVSTMNTSNECNYVRFIKFNTQRKELNKGIEIIELMVYKGVKLNKVYSRLKSQKFYRFIIVDENFNVEKIVDERIFADILPEDFIKTFEEFLLLKYNKNMLFTR